MRDNEIRAQMLKRFESSGLNKTDFCKEVGISRSTFYGWLKKQTASKISKSFIPIEIEKSKLIVQEQKHDHKIVVKTLAGLKIEFPSSLSPIMFGAFVKEIE